MRFDFLGKSTLLLTLRLSVETGAVHRRADHTTYPKHQTRSKTIKR